MARLDEHRDRECGVHTGTCLIETTSGTQLVCPRLDCDYWEPRDLDRRRRGVRR